MDAVVGRERGPMARKLCNGRTPARDGGKPMRAIGPRSRSRKAEQKRFIGFTSAFYTSHHKGLNPWETWTKWWFEGDLTLN